MCGSEATRQKRKREKNLFLRKKKEKKKANELKNGQKEIP